jgi:tyrosine-protein kinase Etk/Wzc
VNAPQPARPDDEISLLDFAIVIAKRKWLVIGLPFVAAVVAAIVSLQLTHYYSGTARLLPPQQSQPMAGSLLGGLGQLGGLAGGVGGVLGLKNPSDIYVGMLKSRTIADALVDRFDLLKVYGAKFRSDARDSLGKASTISVGKDNLITIEVEDPDPKRAAALANAYVEELEKLTGVLAVTEAGQRRVFFERQLAQAKDNLSKAEIAARSALEEGGIAAVDAHGRSLIQTAAMLRARVSAKEVELNSMRGYATEQNPAYRNAQEELRSLREQLAKVERGDGGGSSQAGKAGGLQNVGLLREVRYNELLFEMLARQYEMAKVDEAKEGAVIQILDRAIEAERRSRPRRTAIVAITTAIAFLAAVVLAFVLEAIERAARDPRSGGRLEELKRSLWRRRG